MLPMLLRVVVAVMVVMVEVVVVEVAVVVVLVVVVLVVVVVLLLFLILFAVLACYPLPLKHVAASKAACFNFSLADGCFNDWSPLSPICPWLSSLQVANAQCMTLRSLAPCLRAAREKHRFAAGKNIGTGKNTFGSRKKRPAAGKSYFRSGKNASKKCCFAAGKIQSSRNNTLQQHKSTFAAEKMHFGGSGKPSEAGKNPSEARKNRPRQENNQQQRKSSFATQKVAATEKIHFRNGKKQQPLWFCASVRHAQHRRYALVLATSIALAECKSGRVQN